MLPARRGAARTMGAVAQTRHTELRHLTTPITVSYSLLTEGITLTTYCVLNGRNRRTHFLRKISSDTLGVGTSCNLFLSERLELTLATPTATCQNHKNSLTLDPKEITQIFL